MKFCGGSDDRNSIFCCAAELKTGIVDRVTFDLGLEGTVTSGQKHP